jgi:hypothetical protein
MKNITKYLTLNVALSIALSISLHTVAMEPTEQPIGEADTSIEPNIEVSPETQQILKALIVRLQNLYDALDPEEFLPKQYYEIDKLQTKIEKTIQKARGMYFGIIPTNIEFINLQANKIELDFLSLL